MIDIEKEIAGIRANVKQDAHHYSNDGGEICFSNYAIAEQLKRIVDVLERIDDRNKRKK